MSEGRWECRLKKRQKGMLPRTTVNLAYRLTWLAHL
jgi:hypothetical protein